MKQKIRYILMMITALLGGNGEAWAQTPSYVLDVLKNDSYYEFNTIETGDEYTLSGPGLELSFEVYKLSSLAAEYFYVEAYYNSKWNDFQNPDITTSWKEFKYTLPSGVEKIRFLTKTGATGRKRLRNVKVTRATTLSAPESVNVGSVKIGKSVPAEVNVDFNNTTYPQTLTGSCDNPAFTVVSRSRMGEYGTAPVTINFSPTTAGTHTGKVTLSMNGVQTEFTVTGTAQDKGTPAFTWNLSQAYINRNYKNFFSSTNTDLPYTITSNNPYIAQVVGDSLIVFGAMEGTVNFTVSQQGNDDWHAKTETFSVRVSVPQNHLPLSITENNQAELVNNKAGSYTWEDGIKLGDGGGGFDWEDKIAQIDFQGIPDRISFNYERGNSTASGVEWRVETSLDSKVWTEIWKSTSASGSADIEIKDKSSRYVRLIWSGNFGGFFKNVKISELRYLTSTASSLDFGENVEGDAVSKTFTVKHANAGYGVTLTSSNLNAFEVSPTVLTATGGDKMGEETIMVTYKNNNPGSHNGTITIADPSGSNADIIINVSGSTLSNTLFLNPTDTSSYDVRTYKRIVLQRTLPMGYSTITLPFTYDIDNVEGDAFVAQLELVTHNQQDGYTLYFRKVADGVMQPNQPYVLHMPFEITNAEWGETAISSPEAQSIVKNGWTMRANYTPGVSMEGMYGIAEGKLRKGTAGARINAYTAYFIPPVAKARVRMAVLDDDGGVTYIDDVREDADATGEAEQIYRLDGTKHATLTKGINIVKMANGEVRKVLK